MRLPVQGNPRISYAGWDPFRVQSCFTKKLPLFSSRFPPQRSAQQRFSTSWWGRWVAGEADAMRNMIFCPNPPQCEAQRELQTQDPKLQQHVLGSRALSGRVHHHGCFYLAPWSHQDIRYRRWCAWRDHMSAEVTPTWVRGRRKMRESCGILAVHLQRQLAVGGNKVDTQLKVRHLKLWRWNCSDNICTGMGGDWQYLGLVSLCLK